VTIQSFRMRRFFLCLCFLTGNIWFGNIAIGHYSFASDQQNKRGQQNETVKYIAFDHDVLSILSKGQNYKFDVEIARSHEQRARGLMFRKNMPEENGMLFLFERREKVTMWMENTYIPLDIIFLDAKGIITHIVKSTVPESRDYIHSNAPVVSVLELNAGVTDNLNIQVGDKIIHPFFAE